VTNRRKSKESTEAIPPDCVYSKWQLSSFPNCNTLHELDLSEEIGASLSLSKKGRRYFPKKNATTTSTYIGSGLWRNVWSFQTANPSFNHDDDTVVLKMMKPGTFT
jgi:hypothetical protein